MPATTKPPRRPDDAPSVEELIIELSECPLSAETVFVQPEAVNEIIMMCRTYVVSIEGQASARLLYNRRRH
jgi:hypothetical protein